MKTKKNILIVSALMLLGISSMATADTPKSFSGAKQIARKIFSDNRETLYCHCKYDKYNKIDLKSCGMKSLSKKRRANRVEWEHMMPASHFGQHFKCWREKICTKKKKKYKGRKCCEKIDKRFRRAEAELYNLWPSVGAINQLRSDVQFGAFHPDSFSKSNWYHGCPIVKKRVTDKITFIEPDNKSKGIVARANLFMSQKYNIKLSKSQRRLFEAWNKSFPPTQRELDWASKVAQIEGYENPFIKGGATQAKQISQTAKMLPPAYLSVKGFKKCLSSKSMGTWQRICIPKNKPKKCINDSWKKLKEMDIPSC